MISGLCAARRSRLDALEQKFKLFDGVFGASDEVLGAIASGVDFERKVLEIVQASRTEGEINAAFARLEEELQESIASDMLETREKILTHMDADVVRLLKERNKQIEGVMNAFDQRLMTLAKAELPEARFHADGTPRFDRDGVTYTTEWPLADQNGWRFFRLSDGNLATEIADRAKARALAFASIVFSYAPQQHGVLADVEKLRGKKGWLKASILTLKSARQPIQHLILAALTDEFWSARELQPLLGYSQWRRFEAAIKRAITSCETSGNSPDHHFAGAGKVVGLGSGSEREIEDFHLSRFARYLIAQNGDPRKPEIAAAQQYFAIQARRQEVSDALAADRERLELRREAAEEFKAFSGAATRFTPSASYAAN
jgi:hypothetical protein